jgi:serine phosphatase RsbU (regulator of sigma subunit)
VAPAGFKTGDIVVLLTDGLTEVVDEDGEELGLELLEDLLLNHSRAPLSELYARMVASAARHGVQLDDQTVLLARRTGQV